MEEADPEDGPSAADAILGAEEAEEAEEAADDAYEA